MPDHDTVTTIVHFKVSIKSTANSFTNFSIISCDIFLIPSRTGDKGVVFVVVLSCNCGFDDMVCCWGISGTRQQMWEARCVLLCFALQHYSLAACLKATKKGAKPRPPRSSFHEPHVHHVFQLRGVLTKSFLPNFRIISGFIAVGITCRLRISGLGPVSYWYHDTNLWYLFWPPPKKGITWYQLISSRITWHTSINTKHDDPGGRRASLFGARSSNKRENSTRVVWSTKAHFCFSSCRCLVIQHVVKFAITRDQNSFSCSGSKQKDVAQDDWDICEGAGRRSRLQSQRWWWHRHDQAFARLQVHGPPSTSDLCPFLRCRGTRTRMKNPR